MTRLSTLEAALGWMKRVVSPAPIENPCHWMIAPALFVMLSDPPAVARVACPATTAAPVGFAWSSPAAKTHAIAAVMRLALNFIAPPRDY